MSDGRFRVFISKSIEHEYVIDAVSAHHAETIAENYLTHGITPGFGVLISHKSHPGTHLEVTSQRIPKEDA